MRLLHPGPASASERDAMLIGRLVMATYYIMQDGADFYIHEDPDCEELVSVASAPFRVRDFDMNGATKAREWFVQSGCLAATDTIQWDNSAAPY